MARALYIKNRALCLSNRALVLGTEGAEPPCACGPQQPTGACCLPNGTCSATSQSLCNAAGGVYRGDGTLCSTPGICAGACCVAGNCSQVNFGLCGGVFQGIGVPCSPNPCPPVPPVCCQGDVVCFLRRGAACTLNISVSGVYWDRPVSNQPCCALPYSGSTSVSAVMFDPPEPFINTGCQAYSLTATAGQTVVSPCRGSPFVLNGILTAAMRFNQGLPPKWRITLSFPTTGFASDPITFTGTGDQVGTCAGISGTATGQRQDSRCAGGQPHQISVNYSMNCTDAFPCSQQGNNFVPSAGGLLVPSREIVTGCGSCGGGDGGITL